MASQAKKLTPFGTQGFQTKLEGNSLPMQGAREEKKDLIVKISFFETLQDMTSFFVPIGTWTQNLP